MIPLSPSDIETFTRCPRLYQLRCIRRLRAPGFSVPLVLGSAVDAALERLRRSEGDVRKAAYDVINKALAFTLPTREQQAKADKAKWTALPMITAYIGRWLAEPLHTTDNQLRMEGPLVNPATKRPCRIASIRGIADAAIPLPGGWHLYELKTTSADISDNDTTATTIARLESMRQSIQVPLYQELYRLTHGHKAPCIVDIIKKPVLKRREGKKPAEPELDAAPKGHEETLRQWSKRCFDEYVADPNRYFAREVQPYDEARIHRAVNIARDVARRIHRYSKEGHFPACRSESLCQTAYGPCSMKAACWRGDESALVTAADRYDVVNNETEAA